MRPEETGFDASDSEDALRDNELAPAATAAIIIINAIRVLFLFQP